MTLSTAQPDGRETLADERNPLGLEGVEYVEYRTSRPQAMGQVLELMGFRPVARHRSREVLLYRQGPMNVVINAHAGLSSTPGLSPTRAHVPDTPEIAAVALRVRDAAAAHRRALELGAWDVPVQVAPMELHIPAIHGVGASRIYFVDRHREFSIYDVDFVPIPGVERHPPAVAGLRWFGIVQYVGAGRSDDWCAFYGTLFGFTELGAERSTGVLPSGRVLASPDASLQLQLIEPPGASGAGDPSADGPERLQRVALGTPDVPAAAEALRARGVRFVETDRLRPGTRGALTQSWMGGLMFELIHVDA
jgi:4-hydroxyphenylpyruvate dioxygenase